jgi:plasmid stabilization system protein ParE
MGGYKVIWTAPAKDDRLDIYLYIAKQALAPQAAKNLVKTFKKEAAKLSYMAEGCRIVHKKRGYRRLIVKKNYNIYFTVDESTKTVYIRRVIYARRDLPRLLR